MGSVLQPCADHLAAITAMSSPAVSGGQLDVHYFPQRMG